MTTTTDLHPALQEAFENLPDPAGLTKIIMQKQRDERGVCVGTLFARGDNSQVFAAVTGNATQFGHGPHQEVQYFTDSSSAVEYTKELCRIYLGRSDVDFLAQEGELPIQLAGPGQNPRRRM